MVLAIDEIIRKWVTLLWSVLGMSVGNWVRDNVELQIMLKSVLLVSVQLHEGVLVHIFVRTAE